MIKTKINGKYELYLPKHRAERPEWETGWEVERIESMLSNLEEGDLVLDIGTEEGDISALLAKKTGRIILFEPNDLVWPNIKAIWKANKLPEPVACFSGFAAAKTQFKFNSLREYTAIWPKSSDGELIGNHGFKELADPSSIPEVAIDDFFKLPLKNLRDGEKVKLITIDVEGSEFEVIKGAVETIRKDKPSLYVSVHPESMFHYFKQYAAELCKFIVDLGYQYEVLAFDHEFHFGFTPL